MIFFWAAIYALGLLLVANLFVQDILHTQEQNIALQRELHDYKKNTDEQLQYLKVMNICFITVEPPSQRVKTLKNFYRRTVWFLDYRLSTTLVSLPLRKREILGGGGGGNLSLFFAFHALNLLLFPKSARRLTRNARFHAVWNVGSSVVTAIVRQQNLKHALFCQWIKISRGTSRDFRLFQPHHRCWVFPLLKLTHSLTPTHALTHSLFPSRPSCHP